MAHDITGTPDVFERDPTGATNDVDEILFSIRQIINPLDPSGCGPRKGLTAPTESMTEIDRRQQLIIGSLRLLETNNCRSPRAWAPLSLHRSKGRRLKRRRLEDKTY